MKTRWTALAMAFGMLLLGGIAGRVVEAQEVPRMSVEELRAKLGDSRLVVLDVRSEHDWSHSDRKIAGAMRETPGKVDWAEKYARDSLLVLYCA